MKTNSLILACASAMLFVSGCGAADQAPKNLDASQTAKTYVEYIENGKLTAAYKMLPATYQKDVSDVVAAYGSKIDTQLLTEGLGLIASIGDIAETKADLLLELAKQQGIDKKVDEEIGKETLIETGKVLKKIATGLTAQKLQSGDVDGILGMLESEVIEDFIEMSPMDDMDVEFGPAVVKEGKTYVTITNEESNETKETEWVQVENVWVPADIAMKWTTLISGAKNGVSEFEISAEDKKMALAVISALKPIAEQAKAATTAEELMMVGSSAMGAVMGAAMMSGM